MKDTKLLSFRSLIFKNPDFIILYLCTSKFEREQMALVAYWIESRKGSKIRKLEDELEALSLENAAMCSIELDEDNNRVKLTTTSVKLIEVLRKNKDYKVMMVLPNK